MPSVAVILGTFNHEPYIAEALDSVLSQITTFPVTIYVADDGSTDRTPEIIRSYHARYPDRIKPELDTRNRGLFDRDRKFLQLLRTVQADYIALLEGDDYWTDHSKLQKQVAVLEQRADLAGCFHETRVMFENGAAGKIYGREAGQIVSAEDTISESSLFHTSSFLFRRSALTLPDWFYRIVSADMAMFSIVASAGPLWKIPEIMSVYRKHEKGISSTAGVVDNFQRDRAELIRCLDALHHYRYHMKAKKVIDLHLSSNANNGVAGQSRPGACDGWRTVELPEDVAGCMTMLSLQERQLLFKLARDHWQGTGAIIDAGCFVGGSTLSLARGLQVNRHYSSQKSVIHSYDLFLADSHQKNTYLKAFSGIEPGDSIRTVFDANTRGVSPLLQVHEGDLLNFRWHGEPIELLFIDVSKSWELNDHIIAEFFPGLVAGHSIVIQQDLVHPTCPWLAITMEYFSDYFDLLAYVPNNSIVYRLGREIPGELFGATTISGLSGADKLYLMDKALQRLRPMVSRDDFVELECARCILSLWLYGKEAAAKDLERIVKSYAASPRLRKAAAWVEQRMAEQEERVSALNGFTSVELAGDTIDRYYIRSTILARVKEQIPSFHGTFLDIGCGEMPYRALISPVVDRYIGMDIENPKYQINRKPDLFWDGRTIPLGDASVDWAMATELFEHLPDLEGVLAEVLRVLKPHGGLFFTLPFLWPLHDMPQDEYRYTPFSLQRHLHAAGFHVELLQALGGWDASLAQMIGLWLRRRPMSDSSRRSFTEVLMPFYKELLGFEAQTPPPTLDEMSRNSMMITGLYGIARKPDLVSKPTGGTEVHAARRPSSEQGALLQQAAGNASRPVLAVVCPQVGAASETFIRRHIELLLPGRTVVVTGGISDRTWLTGPAMIVPLTRGRARYAPDIERELIDFFEGHHVTHILCEFGSVGTGIVDLNARRLHLPLFVHFHGQDASEELRKPDMVAYYRWMGANVAGVIAVSLPMAGRLKGIGIPPEKIHVVHSGVSVPACDFALPEREPCRVMTVSRLVPKKGLLHLLTAFARTRAAVPSMTLDIIGDGPLRSEIERFVRDNRLGPAVRLHGQRPHDYVLEKLRGAGIYAQHSITDPVTGNAEGLPVGILEAAAYGLPVVSTFHEGIPEAVEHGVSGYLVKEGDAASMSEYLILLAMNGSLRKEMGLAGRERILSGFTSEGSLAGLRGAMGLVYHPDEAAVSVSSEGMLIRKVLFVNHSIPPYEISGTPISTLNHARGMKAKGLEVAVMYPSTDCAHGYEKTVSEGITFYRVPSVIKYAAYFSRGEDQQASAQRSAVGQVLADFVPDVVQINDYVCMLPDFIGECSGAGAVVIRNVCNDEEICGLDSPFVVDGKDLSLCSGPDDVMKCANCFVRNILEEPQDLTVIASLVSGKLSFMKRLYSDNVDGVIFADASFRRHFEKFVPIAPEKIRINPRGFDFDFPRPAAPRLISDNVVNFAYVGHLIEKKGIGVVLTAFEQIADKGGFRLYIYGGHGTEQTNSRIKRLQKRFPNRLFYRGPFNQKDLWEITKHINVSILPSYFETFGRVVRESLYLGIPAIVTEFFGSDIIEDRVNGLRIPTGDPHSLAAAMTTLIADHELAERLAEVALRTAIPSLTTEIDGIMEFYRLKFAEKHKARKEKRSPAGWSRRPAQPGLVSIVVADAGAKDAKGCVESIQRHAPASHELIFVTGESSDGPPNWLRHLVTEHSDYSLIEGRGGAGLARAFNLGIAASSGEVIVLLRSDVIVTAGWVSGMLDCLMRTPHAGLVGPATNTGSGMQRVLNGPGASGPGLDAFAASFREARRNRRMTTGRLGAACLLLTRGVADSLGLLDERFESGWGMAQDYCLRSELAGFTNVVAGDVYVCTTGSRADENEPTPEEGSRFAAKWDSLPAETTLGKSLIVVRGRAAAEDLHGRDRTDDGLKMLISAIQYAPDDARIYLSMTSMLLNAKRYEEALDVLDQLPGDSRDAGRICLEGYCREGLDQLDEAEGLSDRVLGFDPGSASALNLKGTVAFRRGDREGAEQLFRRALAADPGYGEPHTNLGVLLWSAGCREEALELFARGFMLSPGAEDAMQLYFQAAIEASSLDRLSRDLIEARSIFPDNRRIAFALLNCHVRQERFVEAMDLAEESLLNFGIGQELLATALAIRDRVGPTPRDSGRGRGETLSLCIMARNEEEHLAACLRNAFRFADEVIVADTGSTDRTADIARAFGARVLVCDGEDDPSAVRVQVLAQAGGGRTLFLEPEQIAASADPAYLQKLLA